MFITILARLMFMTLFILPLAQADVASWLGQDEVVWNSPSADEKGSMPIGNGDLGLNVWVESGGDLLFYIGKSDAWGSDPESWEGLMKLARVRVHLNPNPFASGQPFSQSLKLHDGEILIQAGASGSDVTLRVWVDANRPVVHVDGTSAQNTTMTVSVETGWRTGDVSPDRGSDRIAWYHRNSTSVWNDRMDQQLLSSWKSASSDPLINRTFGGLIKGSGLSKASATSVVSSAQTTHAVWLYCLNKQTATTTDWLSQLDTLVSSADATALESARTAHRAWWDGFWNRSHIRLTTGDSQAALFNQKYNLMRYMNACGGRGGAPIKFNGGIFSVYDSGAGASATPDTRKWGGAYWNQNTRHMYRPMLIDGDFEMMKPYFQMYVDAAAVCRAHNQARFGHNGLFFPETMNFWGNYKSDDYSSSQPYIWLTYTASLEITAMLLDYRAFSGDDAYLAQAMPMIRDAITWWDLHWTRDSGGKLSIGPVNAAETFWNVTNDTPDVAGLQWVLDRLLELPTSLVDSTTHSAWQTLRGQIPAIPLGTNSGNQVIKPFASGPSTSNNEENPELYAVYPFRIYGVDKPGLDVGRNTFNARVHQTNFGWQQDCIEAALLGLTSSAVTEIQARYNRTANNYRFPGVYGPNYDWTPDMEHASIANLSLQYLLVQSDDGLIRLLPSWPANWSADFSVRAPGQTTVSGTVTNGQLQSLSVSPAARLADVRVLSGSSVLLIAPASAATYTAAATVTISANAFDQNNGVTKVEYYAGTTKIGEQTSHSGPTYSLSWANVTAGTYALTAKALAGTTVLATSNATTITVTAGSTPAPGIAVLSPTTGSTAGGTSITISGSNFASGATVSIGGTAATNVSVTNSTTITATTPAHAAGAVNVSVTVGGQTATASNTFTYQAPASPITVTGVSPATGSTAGGISITISGSNFVSGATVSIGGTAATNVSVTNSTTITATMPAHAVGTVDVSVTNGGQTATASNAFTYQDPSSSITVTGVSPATGSTMGGTVLTITGSGFSAGATVEIGGTAATNIVVTNSTTITCTTPDHATGAIDVVVTVGAQSATKTAAFTYVLPVPWQNQDIGAVGQAGSAWENAVGTFVVSGSGADIWDVADAFNYTYQTFIGDGTIVARVISNSAGNPGAKTGIMIRQSLTPGSAYASMIVTPGNGLYFQTRDTANGFTGAPGQRSSTPGPNWVKLVRVGNIFTGYHSADGTTWDVVGTGTVALTDPVLVGLPMCPADNTTLATARIDNVTVTMTSAPPIPTVAMVSPATGPIAGGTSITISGTNFSSGASVTIGGTAATNVTVVNGTTITCTTPAHAAGAVNVVVTVGGQIATATNSFTYQSSPSAISITSVSPATGPIAGGTSITITGSQFVTGATVVIGGVAASNVSIINSTTITCTTPAHAAGLANVTVTAGGQSATLPSAFTFTDASTGTGTGGGGITTVSSGSSGAKKKCGIGSGMAALVFMLVCVGSRLRVRRD